MLKQQIADPNLENLRRTLKFFRPTRNKAGKNGLLYMPNKVTVVGYNPGHVGGNTLSVGFLYRDHVNRTIEDLTGHLERKNRPSSALTERRGEVLREKAERKANAYFKSREGKDSPTPFQQTTATVFLGATLRDLEKYEMIPIGTEETLENPRILIGAVLIIHRFQLTKTPNKPSKTDPGRISEMQEIAIIFNEKTPAEVLENSEKPGLGVDFYPEGKLNRGLAQYAKVFINKGDGYWKETYFNDNEVRGIISKSE